MAEPIDAIWAFHHAFRNDIGRIDAAAYEAAKGKEGLATTIERFRFLNEMLVWHATGEELAVFPAVEHVAPLVTEPYEKDHRGLDAAFDELNNSYSAHDTLKTARATAVFRFHLGIHLDKEDTHLYRIFHERIPLPEQGTAIAYYGQPGSPKPVPGNGSVAVPLNRTRRSGEYDTYLSDDDACPCLHWCKGTHKKVHRQ